MLGPEETNVLPEATSEVAYYLSSITHSPADALYAVLSGLPELLVHATDRESQVPVPPAGHRWKEVRHDNTVTWLASWTENIQSAIKYVMLNANSKLKVKKQRKKHSQAHVFIYSPILIESCYTALLLYIMGRQTKFITLEM